MSRERLLQPARNAIRENDSPCEWSGLTEDEGTAIHADPEGDQDVCEGKTRRLESENCTTQHPSREGEREELEATHMPFGDWCMHSMMGRGRTHDKWTNDLSRTQ